MERKEEIVDKERKIVIPFIKGDAWSSGIRYFDKKIFDLLSNDRTGNAVGAQVDLSYMRGGGGGWSAPDYAGASISLWLYSLTAKEVRKGRDEFKRLIHSKEARDNEDIERVFLEENPYLKQPFSERVNFHAGRMPGGFIVSMGNGRNHPYDGKPIGQKRVIEGKNWIEGIIKLSEISLDATLEMLYGLGVREEDVKRDRGESVKALYKEGDRSKGLGWNSFYSKHPILTKELEVILNGDGVDGDICEKYQLRYDKFANQITQLSNRVNSLDNLNNKLVEENTVLKNPSTGTLLRKLFKLEEGK